MTSRTRRPPRGDDVHAERAPRVRGVNEALWGMPGVHVAYFGPTRASPLGIVSGKWPTEKPNLRTNKHYFPGMDLGVSA